MVVDGERSEEVEVISGVLQRMVLGPLLFILMTLEKSHLSQFDCLQMTLM